MKRLGRWMGCAALSSVFLLGGCGDSPIDVTDPDQFLDSPSVRAFVQEIVEERTSDANSVRAFSHAPGDVGAAFSLPGDPFGWIARLTLATTAPGEFDEFCQEMMGGQGVLPGFSGRLQCLDLTIEPGTVVLVDVYLTEAPRTLPGDAHAFTYETVGPVGSITFDPNPHLVWRVELENEPAIPVRADVDWSLRFEGADGEVVDLRHTGSVLAEERPGDVQAFEVSLSFPGLSSSSIPVTVDFAMTLQEGAGFQGSGTVSLGGRTLASISTETVTNLDNITLLFSWTPRLQ